MVRNKKQGSEKVQRACHFWRALFASLRMLNFCLVCEQINKKLINNFYYKVTSILSQTSAKINEKVAKNTFFIQKKFEIYCADMNEMLILNELKVKTA